MIDHDAIESIKQLKARYFRLLDAKDWEALRLLFADDAVVDMRGEGGRETDTADAFIESLKADLDGVTTVHHGHTPEIVLSSATTATGIWAMEDELWWPEGAPLRHMHGFGHYHETYQLADGRWRLTAMTLTRLHRLLE